MSYFQDFPNTNFYNQDLGWLIRKYKELNGNVKVLQQIYDMIKNQIEGVTIEQLQKWLEDGTIGNIITSLGQIIKYFDTTTNLIAANNLVNGMFVKTYGYYTVSDGGESYFYITNQKNDDIFQLELNNNLYANILAKEKILNVVACGIKNDGTTDVSNDIEMLINNYINSGKYDGIEFPIGGYVINKQIKLTRFTTFRGVTEPSITYVQTGIFNCATIMTSLNKNSIFEIDKEYVGFNVYNLLFVGLTKNNYIFDVLHSSGYRGNFHDIIFANVVRSIYCNASDCYFWNLQFNNEFDLNITSENDYLLFFDTNAVQNHISNSQIGNYRYVLNNRAPQLIFTNNTVEQTMKNIKSNNGFNSSTLLLQNSTVISDCVLTAITDVVYSNFSLPLTYFITLNSQVYCIISNNNFNVGLGSAGDTIESKRLGAFIDKKDSTTHIISNNVFTNCDVTNNPIKISNVSFIGNVINGNGSSNPNLITNTGGRTVGNENYGGNLIGNSELCSLLYITNYNGYPSGSGGTYDIYLDLGYFTDIHVYTYFDTYYYFTVSLDNDTKNSPIVINGTKPTNLSIEKYEVNNSYCLLRFTNNDTAEHGLIMTVTETKKK